MDPHSISMSVPIIFFTPCYERLCPHKHTFLKTDMIAQVSKDDNDKTSTFMAEKNVFIAKSKTKICASLRCVHR